ncbi:uncharacterized protein METZ01_LOCUS178730 [marine metagenome]|uniref:DUF4384 domain-containing protein n=1 Tax=marine metagenome TaxID=408172 RepID=A0A382CIB7_9ZZZZ
MSFRYGVLSQDNQNSVFIVEQGQALKSGDLLKLNFEYPKNASFYVCYLSSADEYLLVYSTGAESRGLQETGEEAEAMYETLGWLALDDHTGVETFILIASTEPLSRLEELVDNYDQAKGKSRKRFHKRITQHLKDLEDGFVKEAGVQLTQRLEKPVIAGVTFRGTTDAGLSENTLSHAASGQRLALAVFEIGHK